MRHLLVSLTTLALLSGSGSAVVAQEDDGSPPPVGAFAVTGELVLARTGHTATLLPDGRVLISGGEGLDPEDLETAEVWDPATATFGPAEELVEPRPEPLVEAETERTGHTATLLSDGRALVIGGSLTDDPTLLAEAEILDPASGDLVPAGTLAEPRSGHSATFLRDGRVLVVGGTGAAGPLASAEVWTSSSRPAKCLGKRPTLFAQPGVELVGSKGNDVIAGSVGDDIIAGGRGDDHICGYGGDDSIDGGGGNDTIDGGAGSDIVTGAGGKDRLAGSGGDDTLNGGKGKDVCIGGKGIDRLPACNERWATRGTLNIRKNTTLKGPHEGNIVIWESGVRLDCDGHTVRGKGRQNQRIQAGIGIHLAPDPSRVTVINCHPTNFFTGLQAGGGTSKRLTIRHSSADGNGEGFRIPAGVRVTVADNTAARNDSWGFILSQGTTRSKLLRNVSANNGQIGFALDTVDRNTVASNIATGNPTNYSIAGSRHNKLSDNIAEASEGGFHVADSKRNRFTGNRVTGGGFGLNHASSSIFSENHVSGAPGPAFHLFLGSHDNVLSGNTIEESSIAFLDDSRGGSGTAGTDNIYEDNHCTGIGDGSDPLGLCTQAPLASTEE